MLVADFHERYVRVFISILIIMYKLAADIYTGMYDIHKGSACMHIPMHASTETHTYI